ncbi:hypothetical protein GQR36_08245 [Enterococcus termitis]
MNEQTEIALATSVKEIPNVRIVSFFTTNSRNVSFSQHLKGTKK